MIQSLLDSQWMAGFIAGGCALLGIELAALFLIGPLDFRAGLRGLIPGNRSAKPSNGAPLTVALELHPELVLLEDKATGRSVTFEVARRLYHVYDSRGRLGTTRDPDVAASQYEHLTRQSDA
jgi:hypothetical protein